MLVLVAIIFVTPGLLGKIVNPFYDALFDFVGAR
jgi:hypothetical protein